MKCISLHHCRVFYSWDIHYYHQPAQRLQASCLWLYHMFVVEMLTLGCRILLALNMILVICYTKRWQILHMWVVNKYIFFVWNVYWHLVYQYLSLVLEIYLFCIVTENFDNFKLPDGSFNYILTYYFNLPPKYLLDIDSCFIVVAHLPHYPMTVANGYK